MKWNNLWNVIARNPGVQKTTSRIPLIPFGIAGSLRIAASKSLLMYSQADIQITLFKSICPMLPLIKKTCRSRSFVFLKNYFACCLAYDRNSQTEASRISLRNLPYNSNIQ